MNCPKCNEKLEYINAYSQCLQQPIIDDKGNITEMGHVEEIFNKHPYFVSSYACPYCSEIITEHIKE